jgi:hypothetical protein
MSFRASAKWRDGGLQRLHPTVAAVQIALVRRTVERPPRVSRTDVTLGSIRYEMTPEQISDIGLRFALNYSRDCSGGVGAFVGVHGSGTVHRRLQH